MNKQKHIYSRSQALPWAVMPLTYNCCTRARATTAAIVGDTGDGVRLAAAATLAVLRDIFATLLKLDNIPSGFIDIVHIWLPIATTSSPAIRESNQRISTHGERASIRHAHGIRIMFASDCDGDVGGNDDDDSSTATNRQSATFRNRAEARTHDPHVGVNWHTCVRVCEQDSGLSMCVR